MTVFVDTSALYALLDRDDVMRTVVAEAFEGLSEHQLLTHNYVILEASALVHRRLGSELAKRLFTDILVPVETVWVDEAIHHAATSAYLAAGPDAPSLVDFASFEVMRRHGIRSALAVDRDFADAGFELLPG